TRWPRDWSSDVCSSDLFDVPWFSWLGKARGESVQLEFHQLELRYERLRVVRPEPERRLLASMAEVGQQVPIVVVQDGARDRYVEIGRASCRERVEVGGA